MSKANYARHSQAAQKALQKAKRIREEAAKREEEEHEALEKALAEDLNRIKDMAEWETFAKDGNHVEMIEAAGRMLWIVSRAADQCGIPEDNPDMRIMGGAASALGDLAARPKDIDLHRLAVQSGLLAAERLWPKLSVWALATGALDFYTTTKKHGLNLMDFPQFSSPATA